MTQNTVIRLHKDHTSNQAIIEWAQSALTTEELADFNLALERNTQRYNYLKSNNLLIEDPLFEQFHSNYLQSNITLTVGDLVTYNVTEDNLEKFLLDARWDYYVRRYLDETT